MRKGCGRSAAVAQAKGAARARARALIQASRTTPVCGVRRFAAAARGGGGKHLRGWVGRSGPPRKAPRTAGSGGTRSARLRATSPRWGNGPSRARTHARRRTAGSVPRRGPPRPSGYSGQPPRGRGHARGPRGRRHRGRWRRHGRRHRHRPARQRPSAAHARDRSSHPERKRAEARRRATRPGRHRSIATKGCIAASPRPSTVSERAGPGQGFGGTGGYPLGHGDRAAWRAQGEGPACPFPPPRRLIP